MARKADLDVGDAIEFSETVHINPSKGVEVWIKTGASSNVRPGESGSKALDRVAKFVERKLNAQVDEWYDE